MTKEDFMQIMEQQSKLQVDSMYVELAPLYSKTTNNMQPTTWMPTPVLMSLTNVLDAINIWQHDATNIAKTLCDSIRLNFRRDLLCCYANMHITKEYIQKEDADAKLNNIFQQFRTPMVISCGIDLNRIVNANKHFVYANGQWSIFQRSIISLSIPLIPYQICNSLLILDASNIPCIDFTNPNMQFIPASFSPISDIYNSCHLGIGISLVGYYEQAILLNTCNIYYNPKNIVCQLVITN